MAATLSDEGENEAQERGVIEEVDEKRTQEREAEEEKKDEDVKILTKSVRSMSL